MSNILYDEVPSVDLNDFTSDDPVLKENFVQTLGNAYKNIGFVAVKNHGLSDQLTENLYSAVKEFFALPEVTKQRYEIVDLGGQRGYTSKGKEHAKGRTVGDLKEFYHIGQEITEAERVTLGYPPKYLSQ